ncbi:translation initiation factor IF-2-like [Chiroxiphia lanceolata]|uniref:translation initiation factor IF-2-like n=1 Tax=Chiroxiphia lanceolata TaxID=296741 RepID=UPI0013CE65AF|nr:translation initiation factor IF-2-like [Chiroxiphia lanceolata]
MSAPILEHCFPFPEFRSLRALKFVFKADAGQHLLEVRLRHQEPRNCFIRSWARLPEQARRIHPNPAPPSSPSEEELLQMSEPTLCNDPGARTGGQKTPPDRGGTRGLIHSPFSLSAGGGAPRAGRSLSPRPRPAAGSGGPAGARRGPAGANTALAGRAAPAPAAPSPLRHARPAAPRPPLRTGRRTKGRGDGPPPAGLRPPLPVARGVGGCR